MGCHPSHWRTHIFQYGYCTTNQLKMDNKLGFIHWKMFDFLRIAPIQRDSPHLGGKLVIFDLFIHPIPPLVSGLAGANLFLGKS